MQNRKVSLSIPVVILLIVLSFGAGLGVAPRLAYEAAVPTAPLYLPAPPVTDNAPSGPGHEATTPGATQTGPRKPVSQDAGPGSGQDVGGAATANAVQAPPVLESTGSGQGPEATGAHPDESGRRLPTQFGLIEEVWNILEQDYVDPAALDPGKLTVGAINGVLETLADPHSAYLNAEQNRQRKAAFRGSFRGIGVEVTADNNEIVVKAVISGSPAEEAGILPGDRVLAVNGESTDGMSPGDVARTIRGRSGAVVRMTLMHKGETSPFEVEVTAAEVRTRTVTTALLPSGIAHITISGFSQRTPEELEAALRDMLDAGAEAILLDLRHNPGGLLGSAVDVASQFMKEGVVASQTDNRGASTPHPVKPGGVATDLPMAILLDGASASASEVVAGALQDVGRAALVGAVTAGKGSINYLRELSDGSALYVTVGRWLTPNGRLIEGQGLSPDIPMERTRNDIARGWDPQLQKALEYLEGKLARGR
ncbi:MAG: S41 family peptidase [Chloroflexi bacterium]|nr:S41 family peptidase [Chloroflexota bacterium]